MGSKTKALLDITRFLLALGFGYFMFYQWKTIRASDPQVYPIAAGVLSFIILFLLFRSFGKGEGSGGG
jgi:hypothetical protein